MLERIPHYIHVIFLPFPPCGTMFPVFFYLKDTWRRDARQMKSRGFRCINRVNSGPPNQHQGTCASGSR